jgi:hypothetical protein
MTEEADLITARLRNSAKRAEIREMLETAADAQRAEVNRIAAESLQSRSTDLEKLNDLYENLLRRERVLGNLHSV